MRSPALPLRSSAKMILHCQHDTPPPISSHLGAPLLLVRRRKEDRPAELDGRGGKVGARRHVDKGERLLSTPPGQLAGCWVMSVWGRVMKAGQLVALRPVVASRAASGCTHLQASSMAAGSVSSWCGMSTNACLKVLASLCILQMLSQWCEGKLTQMERWAHGRAGLRRAAPQRCPPGGCVCLCRTLEQQKGRGHAATAEDEVLRPAARGAPRGAGGELRRWPGLG